MTTENTATPPNSAEHNASMDDNPRDHHGSLRSKLVLSLAAMFFVFLTVDELVRQQVIKPEFAALERAGAIRDANRVMAAITAKVENLADLAKHWAGQLDPDNLAGEFESKPPRNVANVRETSLGANHSRWTPDNLEWAAIAFTDGSWRWLQRKESHTATDQDYSRLANCCLESTEAVVSGMTRTADNSLVMFAAVAIDVDSDSANRGSNSRGKRLIVGRTIDQEMIASLRTQTQVDFSLQSMHEQNPHEKFSVWAADESILVVELHLSGLNDEQLANVYVQVPRDITAHSQHTTSMARNSFIFGSVGALLMLLLLLQRIVIGPLSAIREHSDRVAENGFDTEPLVLPSNDEIGELAGAFDHMMRRLEDAQTQLAEASRAAGRSQVASTVIHNVGNVLTNVNSLLDVATGRVDGLRIEPLSKLAQRLRQQEDQSELMAATPDYLEGLAASLDSDRDAISNLINTLHDNVRHIHDVIRDQQRHTGHAVQQTSVDLRGVVDEAIGCCRARLDEDVVNVDVNGPLEVSVRSDRSLLLQTVINVIGNARHALRDNEGPRNLSIQAQREAESIVIRFQDNGIGMNSETLSKVFDAHFTTKKSGSGLGLHFCAITLKRLGGSIRAESEGPGHGSTFIVELPLADQKVGSSHRSFEAAGTKR